MGKKTVDNTENNVEETEVSEKKPNLIIRAVRRAADFTKSPLGGIVTTAAGLVAAGAIGYGWGTSKGRDEILDRVDFEYVPDEADDESDDQDVDSDESEDNDSAE